MGTPDHPVTLTPEQIERLTEKLSRLRHNINNHLSLIIAAVELIRRKPEMSGRMVDTIGEQPDRIVQELRDFSKEIEALLDVAPPA